MPAASPGGKTTVVSAHLSPDDHHLLGVLRSRAAAGDRTLSREIARTLRVALQDERSPDGDPGSANDSAVERPNHASL